jgi:glycosyltransferase involved in cell wall biosynthesis/predicted metal-dependent phosphoesterase TrpH
VTQTTRADLHVHSTASEHSRLGVQRTLGLPECATPPEEVYELAKRRGMDFVTITDHDTIDGALRLADRPDTFISEELTAGFAGEPHQVHVLCYGITPDDHGRLIERAGDVEAVAAYLHEQEIACALAHPFYAVAQPLEPRHRRRLAELFGAWEVRNGARAPELNLPAATYVETNGGTGIGGSDDHAGVDIGRTWTEAPAAATTEEFLAHLRAGRVAAGGDQGSAAKWAHAAMALTVRALGRGDDDVSPDPLAVLHMVERVMREGDARSGPLAADLGPADARALLRAWLATVDLDRSDGDLLAWMQSDGFTHAALQRRARGCHERALNAAVGRVLAAAAAGEGFGPALLSLFGACLPMIPYAPAAAFLGRERQRLSARGQEPARVALVADGVGETHGVTRTVQEIRARGVPGFEVDVIGTDMAVDRRLSAVAEVEMPFYAGLRIGIPSPQVVVEALADGRYDLVHVVSPGPAAVVAALTARISGLPLVGSHHTELAAYARLRTGDAGLAATLSAAVGAFYQACDVVLSPSASADDGLRRMGIDERRIGRWDRGVDLERFTPAKRDAGWLPGERIHVLYAGRLTVEKGSPLLAEAFLAARRRDPRLHLVLAGGGPEEGALRARLGEAATFLGWLDGEELARAYASADMLLFCSQTDTFGQAILEAQASGLPVVAVRAGGPAELVEPGRSGLLCPPDPHTLAAAVAGLAASPAARGRLARGGLAAVRQRTWEAALGRLADGWRRALRERPATPTLRAA